MSVIVLTPGFNFHKGVHLIYDKKLRLLKDFFSTMGMTVNTIKTKVMIIKSKKDTYTNFV